MEPFSDDLTEIPKRLNFFVGCAMNILHHLFIRIFIFWIYFVKSKKSFTYPVRDIFFVNFLITSCYFQTQLNRLFLFRKQDVSIKDKEKEGCCQRSPFVAVIEWMILGNEPD